MPSSNCISNYMFRFRRSDDKDRNEFREFVNKNISFNPHIMFISKGIVLERWFSDLFSWLFECEKIFNFESI